MQDIVIDNRYDPFVNAYRQHIGTGAAGFLFEEDFVEEGIRCIPMIVRFKMDIVGIKLKLAEWSRFTLDDREELAWRSCITEPEIISYRQYLQELVQVRAGHQPTGLQIDELPAWSVYDTVPLQLQEKAIASGWYISVRQWKQLSNLQRFALLKLCRPGHENRNFPKAVSEFGLL